MGNYKEKLYEKFKWRRDDCCLGFQEEVKLNWVFKNDKVSFSKGRQRILGCACPGLACVTLENIEIMSKILCNRIKRNVGWDWTWSWMPGQEIN